MYVVKCWRNFNRIPTNTTNITVHSRITNIVCVTHIECYEILNSRFALVPQTQVRKFAARRGWAKRSYDKDSLKGIENNTSSKKMRKLKRKNRRRKNRRRKNLKSHVENGLQEQWDETQRWDDRVLQKV